ncbi:MAG: histidine phosphatase family protein [Stellaceae bacterium]
MTILLVRHGETEWNLERRFQGRFDSPLTRRGEAQARALGRALAASPDARTAALVASPQSRALRTAEIIRSERSDPGEIRTDERLRELTLGSWDGLTYAEIAERVPGIFDGDGRYRWYFRAPDSEGYPAFAARVGGWLAEQQEAATIIVVAHGLVSRVLRGLYAEVPRDVALTLPVPQDRIFRLSDSRIAELCVQPGLFGAGRG